MPFKVCKEIKIHSNCTAQSHSMLYTYKSCNWCWFARLLSCSKLLRVERLWFKKSQLEYFNKWNQLSAINKAEGLYAR